MKIFILLFLFIIPTVQAEIQNYNFSLIAGTTNLSNKEGEETFGNGLSLRVELFDEEDSGFLISGGAFHTESDTYINGSSEYTYNTTFGQLGKFLYFAQYFRVAAGVALAKVSERKRTPTDVMDHDYSLIGLFGQAGFRYPVGSMILGVDYIYQGYKDFTQKGFYFMFGILI